MATSQDFVNWVCGPNIEAHYLKYVLLSENEAMWRFASGTTHQTIYYPEAKAFHVCLPPLAEQKTIAAVLGALDDKIELNRRMNATLEAMARALFQSWFVDFDPVRAKLDGRPAAALDPATAALFPTQFEESAFEQFPKGWTIREVGEVIDVKHGFAFPGDCFRGDPAGDILLTPGNFAVGGGFKDDKVKYFEGAVPQDYVLREHDLVLTMTDLSKAADTLGYPATIPAPPHGHRYLHNQRLGKVVITEPNAVNSTFLYRLFCSDAYRNEILAGATGTTVKHTSPSRIRAFRTVFPPANILQAFEDLVKPWHLRTAHNRSESRTLATLRDSLLPKLLSGELSVAESGLAM
jgi:type I restriction enzyme S subunit